MQGTGLIPDFQKAQKFVGEFQGFSTLTALSHIPIQKVAVMYLKEEEEREQEDDEEEAFKLKIPIRKYPVVSQPLTF